MLQLSHRRGDSAVSTITTAGSLRPDKLAGRLVVYRIQPQGTTEYRFRISEASRSRHGLALGVEGHEERRKVGEKFAPIPPPEPSMGKFYVPASAKAVVGKKRIKFVDGGHSLIATIRLVG